MKASSGRDHSQSYSFGVRARPSQVTVGTESTLPTYYEEMWAFFFSQWVVFGSLQYYMPSPQVQGHELSIGQASLTSKAQVYIVEDVKVENATSLVGESLCPSGLPCAVTETESMKKLKI